MSLGEGGKEEGRDGGKKREVLHCSIELKGTVYSFAETSLMSLESALTYCSRDYRRKSKKR